MSSFFNHSVLSARVHGVISQTTGLLKVTLWEDTTDVEFLQAFRTFSQNTRRHIPDEWTLEGYTLGGYY